MGQLARKPTDAWGMTGEQGWQTFLRKGVGAWGAFVPNKAKRGQDFGARRPSHTRTMRNLPHQGDTNRFDKVILPVGIELIGSTPPRF
jgi:hypothetical protein